LEHDEHAPDCSHDEFMLRGILASELKCWHRLTKEEAQNLVAFVQSMPSKPAPEPEQPAQQEPVGEITAEDMGRPFNAIRINTHFYKEIPPVGTKLYTTPQPPASKPLSDEEIIEHFEANVNTGSLLSFVDGVRYAEAAHGIGEKK
jgi:hypothetical protein